MARAGGAVHIGQYGLDVVSRLQDKTEPEAIFAELVAVMDWFGFASLILAGIPKPRERLAPLVMAHRWPEGWWERYNSGNYASHDPALHRVALSRNPFLWSATREEGLSPDQRRVLDEAGEFGLKDGLVVPIHDTNGFEAGVSFGGDRFQLSSDELAVLHIIGMYGYIALRPTLIAAPIETLLTRRERECVLWTCEGKTSWEIGEILGIAEATVNKHIHAAERKLHASNRPHLVARALRAGIIK